LAIQQKLADENPGAADFHRILAAIRVSIGVNERIRFVGKTATVPHASTATRERGRDRTASRKCLHS
jgi:hypothetical protein